MIQELRSDYPVPVLCRALEVSTSGYYNWLKRPDSPRQKQEARLVIEIKAAHKRNRETYGPERLQTDLAEKGIEVLAGHKDLCTGEVVGYAMGERMTKNLVSQSLFRAMSAKRPAADLIHHSDRGSQYCSLEFRSLLEQFGMRASMSRRGNCYDNAPIESFWGMLKNELVHHCRYATRREAMREITEYIEIFYNRQRRQRRLGYLSPAAYESKYFKELNERKNFGVRY